MKNLLHIAATKKPIKKHVAIMGARLCKILKSPSVISILVRKEISAPMPCNDAITDWVENNDANRDAHATAIKKAAV